MRRSTICHAALAATALSALTAAQVSAATVTPTPSGTTLTINNGPANQVSPRVSGNLVVYTNALSFESSSLRYYNISTGVDAQVPNDTPGSSDFLAEVDGSRIVFTRNSYRGAAIMLYDVSQPAQPPTELAPAAGSARLYASIGGGTVAWEDASGQPGCCPVVAYDIASGTTTALSDYSLPNITPSVSPDGSSVVWLKCDPSESHCNVWRAQRTGSGWTSAQMTSDNLANPDGVDTNGAVVVYAKTSGSRSDVYTQPATGGPERNLTAWLTGSFWDPSISANIVSFESGTVPGPLQIWNYNLDSDTAYPVSASGGNFTSDLSVAPDGTVNVVWDALSGNGDDIVGYQYHLDAPLTIAHFGAGAAGLGAAAGATFTDADPKGQLSQYSASVDWGDGAKTNAPVVANPLGGFAAGSVHRYAAAGTYTVTITIVDSGGAAASSTKIITAVAPPP